MGRTGLFWWRWDSEIESLYLPNMIFVGLHSYLSFQQPLRVCISYIGWMGFPGQSFHPDGVKDFSRWWTPSWWTRQAISLVSMLMGCWCTKRAGWCWGRLANLRIGGWWSLEFVVAQWHNNPTNTLVHSRTWYQVINLSDSQCCCSCHHQLYVAVLLLCCYQTYSCVVLCPAQRLVFLLPDCKSQ